uniref:Uncharacterized protein n=1 Tax=Penaeus monodon majanivirus A TaxID=2984271 RepID=A0A9C7EXY8_9VIRU|nr:MAG: hypothetical protein [Penaeus monodon majanivirus A]
MEEMQQRTDRIRQMRKEIEMKKEEIRQTENRILQIQQEIEMKKKRKEMIQLIVDYIQQGDATSNFTEDMKSLAISNTPRNHWR